MTRESEERRRQQCRSTAEAWKQVLGLIGEKANDTRQLKRFLADLLYPMQLHEIEGIAEEILGDRVHLTDSAGRRAGHGRKRILEVLAQIALKWAPETRKARLPTESEATS